MAMKRVLFPLATVIVTYARANYPELAPFIEALLVGGATYYLASIRERVENGPDSRQGQGP